MEQTPQVTLKFRPLGNRVLILPEKPQEKTAGGLLLPEAAQKESQRGEVVACGQGEYAEKGNWVEPQVLEGQTVLFAKYGGTEIEIDGVAYLVMRSTDLLGVFPG